MWSEQGKALVEEVASLRTNAAELAEQLEILRAAQVHDQQTCEQLNAAFEDALQQLDTATSSIDQASILNIKVCAHAAFKTVGGLPEHACHFEPMDFRRDCTERP